MALVTSLGAYFEPAGYIGEGVGPGYISWIKGTNPSEDEAVSTNDYWVVFRSNDSQGGEYQNEIVQNLLALNGVSY